MPTHRSNHTTILIPQAYRDMLERLARDLGYLQTRGAGAGRLGSISALMCAIAKGDLQIVSEAAIEMVIHSDVNSNQLSMESQSGTNESAKLD